MEQSPVGDELFFNLLVNKAKLAQSSNATSSSTSSNLIPFTPEDCVVVKGQGNIAVKVIDKVDYYNQILTLTKRVEKLEQELSSICNILQCTAIIDTNNNIAKHKKE